MSSALLAEHYGIGKRQHYVLLSSLRTCLLHFSEGLVAVMGARTMHLHRAFNPQKKHGDMCHSVCSSSAL